MCRGLLVGTAGLGFWYVDSQQQWGLIEKLGKKFDSLYHSDFPLRFGYGVKNPQSEHELQKREAVKSRGQAMTQVSETLVIVNEIRSDIKAVLSKIEGRVGGGDKLTKKEKKAASKLLKKAELEMSERKQKQEVNSLNYGNTKPN